MSLSTELLNCRTLLSLMSRRCWTTDDDDDDDEGMTSLAASDEVSRLSVNWVSTSIDESTSNNDCTNHRTD